VFVVSIYVVRIIFVWLFNGIISEKLQDRKLMKWIPFLDAAFIAYYILFSTSLFSSSEKAKQWK
jgi:hypothetical protein